MSEQRTIQQLEAENALYRAALEYYADKEHHKVLTVLIPLDLDGDGVSEMRYDFGLVAQAALYEGVGPDQIFAPRPSPNHKNLNE